MILGITALGQSWREKLRKATIWSSHLAGGIVGGTMMGFAAVLLGAPIRLFIVFEPRLAICGLALTAAIMMDLGLLKRSCRRRQVPATWTRRYGWHEAFFLYGVILGSGLATYVATAATYGLFAVATLAVPPSTAVVIGAAFGFGRTLIAGLGSLAPGWTSRILYRSRYSRPFARVGSVLTTSLMLGVVVTLVVRH